MAGLLSGLDQLGLGNLENASIFEQPKKMEVVRKEVVEEKPVNTVKEQDYLFDKTHTCPICDMEFKAKTVKVGKAKLVATDMDLRPKYENVDMIKYDIISCPNCGYSALSRFFKFLTSPQAKLIKFHICQVYKPKDFEPEFYSYEEALERYKLTLANAIVKQAKPSEKAYICLKASWLLRGYLETMDTLDKDYEAKKKEVIEAEDEFAKNALEGFLNARQIESFPMNGMDEPTVDHIIAALAMRFEQYDIAARLVSSVLNSGAANPRMKDKARELKNELLIKIKAQRDKG